MDMYSLCCLLQLESTVTLGSLDTNEDEKKELAQRTADFNLRDPIFAELFPEICEVRA